MCRPEQRVAHLNRQPICLLQRCAGAASLQRCSARPKALKQLGYAAVIWPLRRGMQHEPTAIRTSFLPAPLPFLLRNLLHIVRFALAMSKLLAK